MATRQLDPKVLERIAEQHQSGVFFSLKATFDSGTIRLWSGYEDISLPTGNSNANESYLGSGNLITVSTYTESRDLKSDGINIQLAYVTDDIKSIATTESFQNRPIELRMGYMDAGSKDQVAGTFIIFKGRMTNLTINDDPTNPTVDVQCENRLADFSRPSNFRYTNESQHFLSGSSPGNVDGFFRFVKSIQDKEILWGRTASSGGGGGGNPSDGTGTSKPIMQR